MKILLDQNTPHQLRRVLPEHEVHTAAYLGWSELENGYLLEAAASHGYDILVTCDQSMRHEQNLGSFDITLVTIMSGNWNIIRQNIDLISDAIETAVRGDANPVLLPPNLNRLPGDNRTQK